MAIALRGWKLALLGSVIGILGVIVLIAVVDFKFFLWLLGPPLFALLISGPLTTAAAVLLILVLSLRRLNWNLGSRGVFFAGSFDILLCFIGFWLLFSWRLGSNSIFYEIWWQNPPLLALPLILGLSIVVLLVKISVTNSKWVLCGSAFLLLFILPAFLLAFGDLMIAPHPAPSIVESHLSPDQKYEVVRYQVEQRNFLALRKRGEAHARKMDESCSGRIKFTKWKNNQDIELEMNGETRETNVRFPMLLCEDYD